MTAAAKPRTRRRSEPRRLGRARPASGRASRAVGAPAARHGPKARPRNRLRAAAVRDTGPAVMELMQRRLEREDDAAAPVLADRPRLRAGRSERLDVAGPFARIVRGTAARTLRPSRAPPSARPTSGRREGDPGRVRAPLLDEPQNGIPSTERTDLLLITDKALDVPISNMTEAFMELSY